ncbi:MAG: hypothetical protein R6U21_04120 [Thermoplasmatota archaeon]
MRKKNKFTLGAVVFCLLFLSLQSVISANSVDNTVSVSQIQNMLSQSDMDFLQNALDTDDLQEPLWYPGFLIVQLIKGVMAFFIILLILLDIIEPSI